MLLAEIFMLRVETAAREAAKEAATHSAVRANHVAGRSPR
jgi:hypothetical protein